MSIKLWVFVGIAVAFAFTGTMFAVKALSLSSGAASLEREAEIELAKLEGKLERFSKSSPLTRIKDIQEYIATFTKAAAITEKTKKAWEKACRNGVSCMGVAAFLFLCGMIVFAQMYVNAAKRLNTISSGSKDRPPQEAQPG